MIQAMGSMERVLTCLLLLALPLVIVHCDESLSSNAVLYTQENFDENIKENKHFVMFFAPWCGHCKRLSPTWDELAKRYNSEYSDVIIAKVDCTVDTKVCAEQQVRGYPTMKFFNMEQNKNVVPYRGNRDLDSLLRFVVEELTKDEEEEDKKPEQDIKKVFELDSDNFEKVTERGDHFIKFYAPWCGHCQQLAPTWQQLANSDLIDGLMVEKVDCTAHRVLCSRIDIQGYPALLWFRDGEKIDEYTGGRSLEDLMNYAAEMMRKRIRSPVARNEPEVIPEKKIEILEEPVLSLNKNNFDETISEDLTFVQFFVPWCGHCKSLAPTWDKLGKKYAGVKEIKIAKVDCTLSRDLCLEYNVKGYPAMLLFHNGAKIDDYLEERDLDALSQFVKKKKEKMEAQHIEL